MTLQQQILFQLPAGSTPHSFLSLAVAARIFPGERPGQSVSPGTVYRWGTKGLPLADGRIVKLQIWRIGRKYVTTVEAIADFINLQQPGVQESPTLPHSAKQRGGLARLP